MNDINMGIAIVKSTSGNRATVELGSSETKSANIPKGVSILPDDKVVVALVSGKYMIINAY